MFVHLHCHSPYSFLDGAASIESLVAQAAMFGMSALALTDHNTIAGLPEFHKWAATYGIKPISGTEITLDDDTHVTVLAETGEGYENLCRLLTSAHDGEHLRRNPRLPERELFRHNTGLIVFSGCRNGNVARYLLNHRRDLAEEKAKQYQSAFPDSFFIEMQSDGYPQTRALHEELARLAEELNLPLVATSNVHYLAPEQFPVSDILSCIRLQCDVHTPHPERPLNPSRWLHDAAEAARRFADYPVAMENTVKVAERCQVVLKLHESLFPEYSLEAGQDAVLTLRKLVYEGAERRYPRVDDDLRRRLEHELSIIEQLGYVDYFLVVWDIVHYARRNHIRCAGRGSAADSAVAYCLYITDVDAAGRGLLFERFMSLERAEKPDIDVDFDSKRRDEVIAYVYRKYGRDHVARVATYQTFRGRSAIREVGAALGLPEAILGVLAKRVPWFTHADRLEQLFDKLPELQEFAQYKSQLRWLWTLAAQVAGFPRHFGMHVGGVVISKRPLFETTSLQPSAKGEWMIPFDKDAAEDVGLVKLDLLSLRTMSAVEGAVMLRHQQGHSLDYDDIPLDDEETFDMIRMGDTIGVFQLESPAQRALQSRLGAENLEDIVASVALIRPGPIKGNMVDPFLARRKGQQPISYLHPKLEPILGKTYGVVLFQEQVIEIATAIAQFTPGEADNLRRVMSKARSAREMEQIGKLFLDKAIQAGIPPEVAGTIFSYIQGYASYGFCEAHAAAFATTAYKTAYLVKHYPVEYYAAILNQTPMGYYPPHVIAAEARRRGVPFLGVDVNQSEWGCTTANGNIRLGFCMLKGFRNRLAEELIEERQKNGPFVTAGEFFRRVYVDGLTAERLIRSGALDVLHSGHRRNLLWQLPWMLDRRSWAAPLLNTEESGHEGTNSLATRPAVQGDFPLATKLADEYNLLGIGISGHWMTLFRSAARQAGCYTASEWAQLPDGMTACVAGVLVRPHRPPTKSGSMVVFFTLEDETGFVEATMFETVYRHTGSILFTPYGRLIGVQGTVERRGGVRPQLIVKRVWPLVAVKSGNSPDAT